MLFPGEIENQFSSATHRHPDLPSGTFFLLELFSTLIPAFLSHSAPSGFPRKRFEALVKD